MPAQENNGGDVLARGATRAQFRPMGSNVSQEKWDAMWEGYNPENPTGNPEQGTGEKETVTIGTPR